MAKVKDLTEGNPIKLMLLYAIPVLLGNMFQQIYNFADTVIVGRCLGNASLAAVGNTGSLYFFVNGFVMGITSGFAVHVAQCFGAKDYDRMRLSVVNAIFLWTGITIIMSIATVLAVRPVLRLIKTPANIIDESYRYIVVIFAGVAAPMLYNAMSCILRALGDSKTPLYFLVISAILNIGLDFLFIVAFGWGVMGAGLATVIAQAVSGLACVVYSSKKFPILHLEKKDFKLDKNIIGKQLILGLPMAFQFSITAIGTIVLQSAINAFGEFKIAGYTAASKVEQLMTQIGPACGVTTANFVGQNMGAGRYDRIKDGIRKWSVVTIIAAAIAMVVIFFLGKYAYILFIKDGNPEVLEAAKTYTNTAIMFYIPLFLIFVYRNALQAMGKTFMPLMAGFFELGARTVVSLTLPAKIGFKGVCLAGPIAWVSAVVPLFITYVIYMYIFKKKGLLEKA